MLIVTRRVGESLNIGDDITVTVLQIKGNQVRVGIAAPQDVAVLRGEIIGRSNEHYRRSHESEPSMSHRAPTGQGQIA